LALAASLVAIIAPAACSDPFALKADAKVVVESLAVFAMTGTPLGFPAAINTATATLERVDPSFNFDVAFDIDAQGRAVLIPVRLVGGTATASKQVGLQKITGAFDALSLAPTSGYQYDSVLVLGTGEAAAVQLNASTGQCQLFVNQFLYSKLVIDSVSAPRRAIFFRFVHDPNCGFRALVPGEVPKN
jgi:hypothetical protein